MPVPGPPPAPAYNGPVKPTIAAITLDLDDTLWPFAPIGQHIDRVLDHWLQTHSPATAAMFPVPAMQALRERTWHAHPELAHDLSQLRRLTLEAAFSASGAPLDLVEPAYQAFYAARNHVTFYDDALPALERIAARFPVGALTNGNADLAAIGIDHLFAFQLGAREHGAAKPAASIFHAACHQLGLAPGQVLHVGDHIELDVAGAQRAGLRGCWINRIDAQWNHPELQPDLQFDTLTGLADWLDAHVAA